MRDVVHKVSNVLIIDDVPRNHILLADIIQNAGYTARSASSATQALDDIKVLLPDLFLIDISMPEIDGFELCLMLKKNSATKDIPVIFISALSSVEYRIKGYKLGAVDFIVKPFEREEVSLRINTHLRNYNRQQELEKNNKKLYKIIQEQIEKIYSEQKNVLYALAKISIVREWDDDGHIERISKYSRQLSMAMQLSSIYKDEISNSFIDTVELAAPLHDIGKMMISDNILCNKTKLTSEERKIIMKHPVFGADILSDIYNATEENNFIKMAITIARHHHENWDGSGYPDGLSGEEIPFCARIVSIVNRYDVLRSGKCYKNVLSREECMKIINEESGKKFDPNMVNIFNHIQHTL